MMDWRDYKEPGEGAKVRFLGASNEHVRWANHDDPRGLCQVGEVYIVKRVEVHSWHTRLELKEFPGKEFNSVCFSGPLEGPDESN